MAQDKRWDMETAARLLQYGATGKAVAEAVGCLPSEISRHKDTLLSMVVEPILPQEVQQLLRKREPAPLPPQQIEETQTAPVVREETIPQSPAVTAPFTQGSHKPDIQVDISIGKGVVHLEAENARVLETLIDMLVAMGGRE